MALAYTKEIRGNQAVYTATFGTTSPVTGAAPDYLDGIPTKDLDKITVYISAPSGQTFSGAGSLIFYESNPIIGRSARVLGLDQAITVSGGRDYMVIAVNSADFVQSWSGISNTVAVVPSGITFSGGSTGVTITLVGTSSVTPALTSNGG